MPCLHLYPKDLRIPDWEWQRDVVVTICRDCGKVLEIRVLSSQSGDTPQPPGEASAVEIVY